MPDLDIHSERVVQQGEDVVAILSVEIFNRKEYEGMKVGKISPCKIVDDWGVALKELYPMVFVGQKKDIECKLAAHICREWKKFDLGKKGE